MSEPAHILAVDLGTSGPKVALVRADGEIAATASRPVETVVLPGGGAEQDAEAIWSAVCEAMTEAVSRAAVPAQSVVGVALSSQYFSIVPIDRAGRPTMNLVLWMDSRGVPYTRPIFERHPEAVPTWIDVHGLIPMPSGSDSLSHILFVQNERPEVCERTYKMVEPMDYLAARFTGECTANLCTAFPLLLTDNRHPEEPRYDPGLIAMSGVDADKLPPLVPVGSAIGPLRPEVASRLGLLPETLVFSGINDTHAASIAAGTFRRDRGGFRHGGFNIGSTGQVLADADAKQTDFTNDLVTMPSPIPGRFMVMAENGLAGKALDHFMRNVVFAHDGLGNHSAEESFAGLEEVLAGTPAGSRGLLFLPWLTGTGSPAANDKVRGAFLNLSLETGREEMVRAVVEGITLSLCWLLEAVESFIGHELEALHFSGGAARSDGWSQIAADISGRPVRQLEDAHYAGARAAAFLAFEQLGLVGLDEVETICRTKHEYLPQPQNREIYERHFEQFLHAREQNVPVFEALNG